MNERMGAVTVTEIVEEGALLCEVVRKPKKRMKMKEATARARARARKKRTKRVP